jgi:hypothetical protein
MDKALDELAAKMKAIRERQEADNAADPSQDHVEADGVLWDLLTVLGQASGYDVTDILEDYDALMKWYA